MTLEDHLHTALRAIDDAIDSLDSGCPKFALREPMIQVRLAVDAAIAALEDSEGPSPPACRTPPESSPLPTCPEPSGDAP
jgi:hypothetical protein